MVANRPGYVGDSVAQTAGKQTLIFGNPPRACLAPLWLTPRMTYRTERDDAQRSFAGNPVVASVPRENVRVVDGRAIIGLWGGWPCLLSEIPAFGKVLAITRNFHAVVGNICEGLS